MERKIDIHEPDSHFDEKFEGPLNDPLAMASEIMGVRTDVNSLSFNERKKAFEFKSQTDPEMAKFEKIFRGNSIT